VSVTASDYCNIVLPLEGVCAVPPGWGDKLVDRKDLRECYRCGLPVCIRCSQFTIYNHRRVRMCSECIEEEKP
jgi:hypothetical protein